MLCQMNIDECASNPCENEARCEDQINDYFCHCYPGYEGNFKLNSFSPPLLLPLCTFPFVMIGLPLTVVIIIIAAAVVKLSSRLR